MVLWGGLLVLCDNCKETELLRGTFQPEPTLPPDAEPGPYALSAPDPVLGYYCPTCRLLIPLEEAERIQERSLHTHVLKEGE